MRRTRRPLLAVLALAALLILAAAGYAGYWFYAVGQVRGGLADWAAARRAEGYAVSYAGPTITGFPFEIRVRLDQPMVVGRQKRWRWAGDGVEAVAAPWSYRRIVVRPLGHQTVSFPSREGKQEMVASAADAVVVVAFDSDGRFSDATLDAESLTVAVPDAPGPLSAEQAHIELHLPDTPTAAAAGPGLPPSAALSVRVQNLDLPEAAAGPLGSQLRWVTAYGQLLGTLPPGSPAQALAAWRDAGGTLELKSFGLTWGPLQIEGNATVALDDALQPEGAGSSRIRGYAETIDALVAQGLIKPNNGMLAKAALGLLAKAPADGGPKVLTVPLTIQKRELYAGPIGLLHIPPIKWAE
jgi:hypothetical protein